MNWWSWPTTPLWSLRTLSGHPCGWLPSPHSAALLLPLVRWITVVLLTFNTVAQRSVNRWTSSTIFSCALMILSILTIQECGTQSYAFWKSIQSKAYCWWIDKNKKNGELTLGFNCKCQWLCRVITVSIINASKHPCLPLCFTHYWMRCSSTCL